MRPGRKRKLRARYANGRLVYKAPNDRTLAAAQPHRRELPEALRLSELPATMIGTLYGRSLVTEPQRIAGERFGQVGNQYLASIPGLQRLINGGRGDGCDAGLCQSDDRCICKQRERSFLELRNVLVRAGPRLVPVVTDTCVFDKAPGDLELLRMGLTALVRYLRL